ncbi:Ni-sirohydrochlorin a,c-diamide synthase [Methanofollis aquaemaris]|uniref:Cobyrinate a,c-diamide synthase n=1 Tax=Methanofollis aquaemaris TaxID=126734 RepID=A0A8A3S3I4_9EURY|nr:Ni-sirohydrochlorin a,c-diamide synthase [Methanofollis aquaemaris]QSZ66695.1 Ni-sirohydrochlorin a,c-diamide synthase [Methanofollis aquaemaris]
MKGLLISGDRSGSGKTSITLALAALLSREATVQTYKVAMDYIDPSYLTAVTGRPCRNLDSYVMSPAQMQGVFEHGAKGADLALVEGVRGLFEGAEALGDAGSTASVAKALDLPVVLVVDARSITRSAAAIVNGYAGFDPEVKVAGVILNNIRTAGHREKTTRAIEHYCGLPVIGAVPRDEGMQLAMRHLGLVPYREGQEGDDFLARVEAIQDVVASCIDLDALKALMVECTPKGPAEEIFAPVQAAPDLRVAVAYDEAFNFYYNDLFDLLGALGAEVVTFSPIHDPFPEADGYILGGGYPELYAGGLEKNVRMREGLRAAAENDVPIYAECGGLIYLTDRLVLRSGWQGREHEEVYEMCGVLPGEAAIPARRSLGYVEGRSGPACPFGDWAFRGHEFHYSEVILDEGTTYAYRLSRGTGISGGMDGAVRGNVLASYTHLHPVASAALYRGFVSRCRERLNGP